MKEGYSLRRLAERAGLDYSRLAKIEQGTRPSPDLATTRALAELLDLDLATLLVSAGTAREVVETLVWSERARMAEALRDLEAYAPNAPDLLAKNTFAASIEDRDGALCHVRLGNAQWTVLSFAPGDRLSVAIPPEGILVERESSGGPRMLAVENVVPAVIRKVRHLGQITNLVLACNGLELNSLHTREIVEILGLSAGDRVMALVAATAIRTSPIEEAA